MKTLSPTTSAFISIDNTKTFEDKNLHELYVNDGEQAAYTSKKVVDLCKIYGLLTINVLEQHPLGHISLANNYNNKKAFDTITYSEVKTRTEDNNGIGSRAQFTLPELKNFLSKNQSQMLRPDHSIQHTPGVELTPPLQMSDFDLTIIKGTNPATEGYSGFDDTSLAQELQIRNIQSLFIGGVATDYCVGKTALDAINKGFDVYLLSDAIKGVAETSTQEMLDILNIKGVKSITSQQFTTLFSQNFTPENISD